MVVSAVPIKVDECRDRDKGFAWVFSFVPIFPANAMKNHCFIFSRIALVLVAVTFHSRAAMLTVTTTSDTGPGSLRERIEATGIGDTIVFASSVTGMITLTNGDLILRRTTFIDGPGPNVLTISGFGSNGVFQIANFGDYRISGLTVANGASWAGNGGGIYNDGSLTVLNSTISSNQATLGGGILNNLNTATLTIINSTIAGNIASSGGGILASGSLAMTNCTIVGNQANAPGPSGGGVNVSNLSPPAKVRNTIIALNVAANSAPDVIGPFSSQGYNFIGSTNWGTGFGATGDRFGNNNARLNPVLTKLQDNGGSTPTLAPLPGSPVIDRGHSSGLHTDQRGRPRPSDLSNYTNGASGDGADIGAVELSSLGLIVRNTQDTAEGSLRYALFSVHQGEGNIITFQPGLRGTITLTSGELVIEHDVTIVGPGANELAISGANTSRVFEILTGKVAISGLTIRNGRVANAIGFFEQDGSRARGGGVFNQTTLALTGCIISSNSVVGGQGGETAAGFAGGGGNGLGGGIFNAGTLSMTNCTLKHNSATGGAGGVATGGGSPGSGGQGFGGGLESEITSTLVRCTISGNRAIGGFGGGGIGSGSGGGLYNLDSLALYTCTVASNLAGGSWNRGPLGGTSVLERLNHRLLMAVHPSGDGPQHELKLNCHGFTLRCREAASNAAPPRAASPTTLGSGTRCIPKTVMKPPELKSPNSG